MPSGAVRMGEAGDWARAIDLACTRPGVVRPHFQPIVDVRRGIVAGYEALARFVGPPAAPPDRWFAVARGLGRADELEARSLHAALEARTALPPNTFLSVNLGPQALTAAPVQAVLAAAGDLRGLVVELTEQVAVEDYGALGRALEPLRAAGALVAVDDAGAGYASLQHVIRLRPELVKIDRDLVAGVDRDPAKSAVVEMLGFFASRIDAWVVTEGVETPAELAQLARLGTPLAQGFLLARPSPSLGGLSPEGRAALAGSAPVFGADEPGASEDRNGLAELAAPVVTALVADAGSPPAAGDDVVLVDEFGRPVAMRSSGDAPRPVLAVDSLATLPEVAHRAMTRPADRRFDPIVVCDDLCHVRGLVRVEELVAALARAA